MSSCHTAGRCKPLIERGHHYYHSPSSRACASKLFISMAVGTNSLKRLHVPIEKLVAVTASTRRLFSIQKSVINAVDSRSCFLDTKLLPSTFKAYLTSYRLLFTALYINHAIRCSGCDYRYPCLPSNRHDLRVRMTIDP